MTFSLRSTPRLVFGLTALTVAALLVVPRIGYVQSLAARWYCYGHDPQHTAISTFSGQHLSTVHWQTPVDLVPQYSGGNLYIHYGSPLCTAANTIIVPVKTGAGGGFQFEAHDGATGAVKWTQTTDYILFPHNWTPAVSGCLTPTNRFYYPGAGGTLLYRDSPDAASGATGRIAYYGLANYNANPSGYNNVYINTPITVDRYGSLYFGVYVNGSNPLNLQSSIVRISYSGVVTTVAVPTAAGDSSMAKVPHNCAIALSNDHGTAYVAVTDNGGSGFGSGYLLALNCQTLARTGRILLKDVKNTGNNALVADDGTASPTVGPDGDVYYGVLENPFFSNHLRGWLLHFNSALTQSKTAGPFGWDDTASIVPSSMVPSYHGTSTYLLLTKYNNYAGAGGDGVNKMGVFDPKATMTDPITGATVMKEILAVAGPTPDDEHRDASHPNAVREWCINTAAVDVAAKAVYVNCEDGTLYRWDLANNTLSESILLEPPTGEAYTPTIVGVDGTVYAINNAKLYAVGN